MLPPFPLDSDGALLAYAELLERHTDNHTAIDRIRWWATIRESLTAVPLGPSHRASRHHVYSAIGRLPRWMAELGSYEYRCSYITQYPIQYPVAAWFGNWTPEMIQRLIDDAWAEKLLGSLGVYQCLYLGAVRAAHAELYRASDPPNQGNYSPRFLLELQAACDISPHLVVRSLWYSKSQGQIQEGVFRAGFAVDNGCYIFDPVAYTIFSRLNRESRKPGRPRIQRSTGAAPIST